MIETDYPLDNASSSPPEAAKPILASQLLDLEEKQGRKFVQDGKSERISTYCLAIDELLGGGVERGIVVGMSSEGSEGRLISLSLIASILLPHTYSTSLPSPPLAPKVNIIDTTGSFPLSLLVSVLKARISRHNIPGQSRVEQQDEKRIERQVQKCLEMVAISRVFDIEGLWEVLGEVRSGTLSYRGVESTNNKDGIRNDDSDEMFTPRPAEINDSQGDSTPEQDVPPRILTSRQPVMEEFDEGTEIIIVDNMTHIIDELFARKERTDAYDLFTLLSQTVHTLSSSTNILTILHNTTKSSRSKYNAQPSERDPEREQRNDPSLAPASVFPSNPMKPALGHSFNQFPSLHILTTPMPKTRGDAENLYAGDAEEFQEIKYCTVLEVLKDETPMLAFDREKGRKLGWREGRWAAVEIAKDGLGLVGAFERKEEAERAIGGNVVESRVGLGVGTVAKIYGFGGRRV